MKKITNPWGNCNPIIEYEVMATFLNNGGTPEQCGHIVAAMMDYWEKGCPEDYDNELDLMEWSIFELLKPKLRHGLQQYINGTNPKGTQRRPKPNPKETQTEPKGNPKETQTEPKGNPIEYEYRIENREDKEEDDDIRAREEISSSSSENFVLGNFDKLCDEMLTANGTFAANVRTMNPRYNVPDEKFDGWIEKFRHYKHTVGDDGLKSRNDVRRNFINWLPAQIRAEESGQTAQVSAEDIAFTEEQKKVIAAHCHPVQLFQATADLVRYCTKNKLPPERAVSDFAEAIENGWGYFELQAIIRKGGLLPKTRKDGKRIGTAKN